MIETKYYKKYSGKSGSIVDALKAVGVSDVSMTARKKIAVLNGIKNYAGTAAQNTTLLKKLKSGKLIKSKKEIFKKRDAFLKYLHEFHPTLKKYGKQLHYSYKDAQSTFEKAVALLKKGKKTGLTCVVPCRWAMKEVGISPSGFYGKNGSFSHCYKDDVKTHLTRITSKEPIGLTVKKAVDKGLLHPGDIIAFQKSTHTFVYTGEKYLVFDGGHAAIVNEVYTGIVVDYSVRNATRKISEILRWKD